MRTRVALVLCSLSYGALAQDWCTPGATWVYRFEDGMTSIDFRVEHRYTHDTLIDGFLTQVIAVRAFGTGLGGGIIDQLGWAYERTDGEVVHTGSAGNWDTLYWFGEIGDRWWPIGADMFCPPPHGMLEIADTGQVNMGLLTLKTWDLVYLDSVAQPMSGPITIIERIGGVPRSPMIIPCGGAIEYFTPSFICYSDSELVALGEEACAIDLGIEQPLAEVEFTISPTATDGPFMIQCTEAGIGGEVSIFDPVGRRVLRLALHSTRQAVDLAHFPAGLYRALLTRPDGAVGVRSLVKY